MGTGGGMGVHEVIKQEGISMMEGPYLGRRMYVPIDAIQQTVVTYQQFVA